MKQVWRYARQQRHQLQVDLGVRGKFTPRQKMPAHLLIAFLMISKVNDGTNWRKQWRFVWKKTCCHSKLLKMKDWSEWSINWTQDTTCLQGSTLLKQPCQQCMKSAVVGYKQHCLRWILMLQLQTCGVAEPYISLTVHYITSNWSLNSCCIQTSFFPDDHTGENIASGLKQFL